MRRICDYCGWDAAWLVAYYTDGTGKKLACARHLNKAAREVGQGLQVPKGATLRLVPLVNGV